MEAVIFLRWCFKIEAVNYSQRIGFIKSYFSLHIEAVEVVSASRQCKRERGIWQHMIRDEADYARQLDYIHYNPVKHGYVTSPYEWEYSSIHRYRKPVLCSINHSF